MKGMNRRAIQAVARLSERARGHDRDDILATVAALQLIPENAHRQARLMAFAHAVAALRPRPDLPPIRRDEFEVLIESPLLTQGVIAEQDELFENIFTEAFSDIGGSFTIFAYSGEVEHSFRAKWNTRSGHVEQSERQRRWPGFTSPPSWSGSNSFPGRAPSRP